MTECEGTGKSSAPDCGCTVRTLATPTASPTSSTVAGEWRETRSQWSLQPLEQPAELMQSLSAQWTEIYTSLVSDIIACWE